MAIRFINKILRKFNYSLIKEAPVQEINDMLTEKDFMKLYGQVKPYTMTSLERIFSLYTSVQYVLRNNIPGSFVECGVWKGGSSMTIALCLLANGSTDRDIYMYDTFEGMPEPTERDVDIFENKADELLNKSIKEKDPVWCYSTLEEVKINLLKTNYPPERMHFIKGKVEDTIPGTVPPAISLLRLDTDWYESTRHELQHLFPLLEPKGVLILDDYGHWQGARKAVDEYLQENKIAVLLNRIDYTGRIAIKY